MLILIFKVWRTGNGKTLQTTNFEKSSSNMQKNEEKPCSICLLTYFYLFLAKSKFIPENQISGTKSFTTIYILDHAWSLKTLKELSCVVGKRTRNLRFS